MKNILKTIFFSIGKIILLKTKDKLEMKLQKLRDKYILRYLIAQHKLFTRLCLMNLFIKINL